MGRKRKNIDDGPTLQELLEKVWCYYCERDFPDSKILLDHQRSKHFQCTNCSRRLNTAGGLRVHMSQVHKLPLEKIQNALPDRQSGELEIFAMEGIPQELIDAFKSKVTQLWYENGGAEREAKAQTMNQPPAKKQQIESLESIKARKAAFIAQKKAEKAAAAAGGSISGASTPSQVATPSNAAVASEPPVSNTIVEPSDAQNATPVPMNAFIPPAQYNGMSMSQVPPYAPIATGFPPAAGTYAAPYAMPMQGYPGREARSLGMERLSVSVPAPPVLPNAPYPPYNGPSTAAPSIPGLPNRPSFNSPNLDKNAMAKLHGTSYPGQQPQAFSPYTQPAVTQNNAAAINKSVDELIASGQKAAASAEQVKKNAGVAATTPVPEPVTTPTAKNDASGAKKSKKSKSALTVMMVADTQMSPEQKLAKLSKYKTGYTVATSRRKEGPSTEAGEATAAVTGTVDDGFAVG